MCIYLFKNLPLLFVFQSDCHKKGGYIAEINSKAENDYIKQHILGNYIYLSNVTGKIWPSGYKAFAMLNSTKHEIYPAHKP